MTDVIVCNVEASTIVLANVPKKGTTQLGWRVLYTYWVRTQSPRSKVDGEGFASQVMYNITET